MQTLSMIDMGAKRPAASQADKPVASKGPEFAAVLNDQQAPAQAQPAKQTADGKEAAAKVAADEVVAAPQAEAGENVQKIDQAEFSEQVMQLAGSLLQALTAEPQQQTDQQSRPEHEQNLLNLLDTLAAAESLPEKEAFGALKSLLGELVQQLDAKGLPAGQELAGGDSSAWAEQIEQLLAVQPQSEESAGDPSLKQLLNQLAELLTTEVPTKSAEQSGVNPVLAAALPEEVNSPQAAAAVNAEMVTKEPQLINVSKGQDVTGRQPDTQAVATAAVQVDAESVATEETAEPIDPRFAGLLKPNVEEQFKQQLSLRERIRGEQPGQGKGAPGQVATAEPAAVELTSGQAKLSEFVEAIGPSPQQVENLSHLTQGAQQQAGGQINANLTAARTIPETATTVQLPSGQQVAESQIFDQVVARFSGSFNGDSGRMTLRLQPAELGSLKLDLKVEGDRITANFQAQSQQVQEILERNLPQLRSALAEQGLKIDHFQVNVNQQQNQQSQFDNLAQQQQQRQGFQQQPAWKQGWQQEDEQIVPLAHLMQNGGGGINLHV